MKHLCIAVISILIFAPLHASGKTKVAVETFQTAARPGSCFLNGWGNSLGREFQREISNALFRSNKYEIVSEKEEGKEIHYSVLGAIRQFESCSFGAWDKSKEKNRFRRWVFGLKNSGLKEGYKHYSAKVLMDILIIDNETREVVEVFSAKGKDSQTLPDLRSAYDGLSFNELSFVESPIGQATKNALLKSLRRILTALPEKRSSVLAKGNELEESELNSMASTTTKASSSAKKFVCRSESSKTGFSPCRIIGLDETNSKVKVIDEYLNEKLALSSDSIYRLVARNRVPKRGVKLFVDLELSGLGDYENKRYLVCSYSDRVGTNFIVNCQGTDYAIDFKTAYYKQKVKIKLPNQEQLVSR